MIYNLFEIMINNIENIFTYLEKLCLDFYRKSSTSTSMWESFVDIVLSEVFFWQPLYHIQHNFLSQFTTKVFKIKVLCKVFFLKGPEYRIETFAAKLFDSHIDIMRFRLTKLFCVIAIWNFQVKNIPLKLVFLQVLSF